ncbi:hypothetical protein RBJ15_00155 [Pantoea sp. BS_4]|uniref:hypothetical protein n=1 Tax=unclassified Pantoea TaxID=2630326 RepID=UPI0035BF0F5C
MIRQVYLNIHVIIQAGKVTVENNYLSSTEKSRQTDLNHKQSLTPQEQKEKDMLNRKDAETSKAVVDACMSGSAEACSAARQDMLEKQGHLSESGSPESEGSAGRLSVDTAVAEWHQCGGEADAGAI